MRVLVCVKKVVDYAVKVRLKQDRSGVMTEGVKHIMNPFDEIALEEAIRMKERGHAKEVISCSCSPSSHKDILQHSLALGADKAVHMVVNEDVYRELQPLAVAQLLRKVVESKNPDVVLLGKQAIDDDCNQTGQILAALLDWPQATCASKTRVDAKSIVVERESDVGTEELRLPTPCVITTDLRLNTPRYATLPNIMKSRSMSVELLNASDAGVDMAPRVKTLEFSDPPTRSSGVKVKSVDELLSILGKKGFLKI